MTYTFKKAKREGVQILLSVAGGTGSGKTWSAMLLAKGLSGGKRFCVIDSERGRASHYADAFDFDTCEINEPFSPDNYTDAVMVADAAGYPVIVVDSLSHSWAGSGGCLDIHEAELNRMAGDDWKKREACKLAAWVKPKMAQKKMVQKLLQVRGHVILCMRAEPKIEAVKEDGKIKMVPKESAVGYKGWIPIVEKNLPFEMTASFMLVSDSPGIPHPIKLPQQFKHIFPLDKPITEDSGARLGEWARGGAVAPEAPSFASYVTEETLKAAYESLPPDQRTSAVKAAVKERLQELRAAKAETP